MEFYVDKENRRVVLYKEVSPLSLEESEVIINEFDVVKKGFLPNTVDKYECELVLLDVDKYDEDGDKIGVGTKAFARRIGNEQWLMEFDVENYSKA